MLTSRCTSDREFDLDGPVVPSEPKGSPWVDVSLKYCLSSKAELERARLRRWIPIVVTAIKNTELDLIPAPRDSRHPA